MNIIEINNPTQKLIVDSFIEEILEGGIAKLKKERIIEENLQFELSVALVDKESIRRYNLEYRKVDEPTDVLSFCYEVTDEKIVGEIVLCFDVIEKYALEDGLEVLGEFEKNLIHSLLHIIGFEHEEEMFALQEKMLGEEK
jgi:probable rRNA maturation factor